MSGLYMIRSTCNVLVFFLYALLLFAAGMATYYYGNDLYGRGFHITLGEIFFIPAIVILDVFALIYPLESCYVLEINSTGLTYRWVFKLQRRHFPIGGINGYYTMLVASRDAEYMYAYPVSGSQVLPALSEFSTSNYKEILEKLPGKHLGQIPLTWNRYYSLSIKRKLPGSLGL